MLFPLTIVSLSVSAMVFLYHAVLAIVSIWPSRRKAQGQDFTLRRYAIIIPAHNEEETIRIALESCQQLQYPKELVEVFVVADNCDDSTAEVAAQFGANVLVRKDTQKRGKGYALQFALEKVLIAKCDAILVLDADCSIDGQALKDASLEFNNGGRVLQCNYRTGNCDDSPTSLVLAVANVLENDLFYAPKSRLGLYVLLRGTGMVFEKSVLECHPWNGTGVVEDAEYSVQLSLADFKVRFLPNTHVYSAFPSTYGQLSVQRTRWLGGGIATFIQTSPRLFWEGLKRRKIVLIDAAITPLLATRPLVVLQLMITIALATTLWFQSNYLGISPWLMGSAVFLGLGYIFYALFGLSIVGCNRLRLRLLLRAPLVFLSYFWISMRYFVKGAPTEWERTPRDHG